MTQGEKRQYLIKELLAEEPMFCGMKIPENETEQKNLLRSLMNVRPPRLIEPEFLRIQNEYLCEEAEERGIVDGNLLPVSAVNSRFVLWQGDITTLKVDAIVNAANCELRGCFVPCHSCVDNMIHSYSGIQLRILCDTIMRKQGYMEPEGEAKITPAYNLPSRFILHTVGPFVSGVLTDHHRRRLADCYKSCMELASRSGIKSIAFCCISTGVFRFPRREAAEIAVRSVTEYLKKDTRIERVIFDVFNQEDYDIYKTLL